MTTDQSTCNPAEAARIIANSVCRTSPQADGSWIIPLPVEPHTWEDGQLTIAPDEGAGTVTLSLVNPSSDLEKTPAWTMVWSLFAAYTPVWYFKMIGREVQRLSAGARRIAYILNSVISLTWEADTTQPEPDYRQWPVINVAYKEVRARLQLCPMDLRPIFSRVIKSDTPAHERAVHNFLAAIEEEWDRNPINNFGGYASAEYAPRHLYMD